MTLTNPKNDYSKWYNEIVEQAQMAENSDVRGCMIIKPYGFAIRDNIKNILDRMFKNTGHQNAYFPMLLPKSYLSKEANHIEGFAKECAVVTHYRLKTDKDNGGVIVDPEAKLEEELIIRPTSETIIWKTYKNRVQSYRDLPILINQRANVMRWEMRTRLFLRTSEFLRQEGHTAHATSQEAIEEAKKMLNVYDDFVTNFLGMFSFKGEKPEHERFPGAIQTLTFEPMMGDGKALQMGTSHFLGQKFAKAFDVKFRNEDNEEKFVWATSWGVSTRMIGGLIMAHSDEKGLILPPAIAPLHIIIIPIFKNYEDLQLMKNYLKPLFHILDNEKLTFNSQYFNKSINIEYKIDDDKNHGFGRKCTKYELQGIPVRITVGKKEIDNGEVELYTRRNQEKKIVKLDELLTYIDKSLYKIQNQILQKHFEYTLNNTLIAEDYDDFQKKITDLKANQNKFVFAHWDGTKESATKIQEDCKATIRCIPFDSNLSNISNTVLNHLDTTKVEEIIRKINKPGKCIISGKPSSKMALFAKAY